MPLYKRRRNFVYFIGEMSISFFDTTGFNLWIIGRLIMSNYL